MKTLIIGNLKGGVGKTTFSASLAYVITQVKNKRVLMIDVDAQGNLSNMYMTDDYRKAVHSGSHSVPTVSDIFQHSTEKIDIENFYIETDHKNLYLVPSYRYILAKELRRLSTKPAKELALYNFLKKYKKELEKRFEYIIIDTPPSLESLSTVNALVAADKTILVCDTDMDAVEALYAFQSSYFEVLSALGRMRTDNGIDALIINKVDDVTKKSREFSEFVKELETFKESIVEPFIHASTALSEIKLGIEDNIKRNPRTWRELNNIVDALEEKGVI